MKKAPFTIFILEDDEWYNNLLVHTASLNPDYEVKGFTDPAVFLGQLHLNPDVVTLDFSLGETTGMEVLKAIRQYNQDIEVIIVSEQQNIETAVELLKLGAYDYLVKTTDIKDRLLNVLNNLWKKSSMKEKISELQQEVEKKYDFQQTIIGQSTVIKNIYGLIEKAIDSNITVSLTGETGTGKELVAKAIHYNSARKKMPFVAVNLAAIPAELTESELFGHEKGAFTGAASRRIGKFEEANGGTLFLDEIGEMELSLQSKLLRALQEREITRVGSNTAISFDCRVIIATHRNLKEEIKKGSFREDLYYRLLGLPIELPPLRARDKDVLVLAKFFIEKYCRENNIPLKHLSENAQKKLLSYAWPGNVRELKSIVELAVVMSDSNIINAEDIRLSSEDILPDVMHEEISLREYNLRILDTYLKKYDHQVPLVAQKLDISQATIYRMLKEMKQ